MSPLALLLALPLTRIPPSATPHPLAAFYNVSRTLAPLTLAAPADVTIVSGESMDPAVLGSATATGVAPQSMQITYRDVVGATAASPLESVERTIRRIWTANDVHGRSATSTQRITLLRKTLSLDVRPGSCPNEYALNGATALVVSLVGSTELDVHDVDATSLELWIESSGDGPVRAEKTKLEDNATPYVADDGACHAAKGDGRLDLSLRFGKQALLDGLHLRSFPQRAQLRLVLTGRLADGSTFRASDGLRLR